MQSNLLYLISTGCFFINSFRLKKLTFRLPTGYLLRSDALFPLQSANPQSCYYAIVNMHFLYQAGRSIKFSFCHSQACPALRAPGPSRTFNRARSSRQMQQQAGMPFLFPVQPSLSLRLSRCTVSCSLSRPPAMLLAPRQPARAIRAPLPALYKLMPPGCHLQARPALRAPRLSRP